MFQLSMLIFWETYLHTAKVLSRDPPHLGDPKKSRPRGVRPVIVWSQHINSKAERRFEITSYIVEISPRLRLDDSSLFACVGSFHRKAQLYLDQRFIVFIFFF